MSPDNQQDQKPQAAAPRKRRMSGAWLFGILILGIIVITYRPDIETVACNDDIIAGKPDVVMLGTWWCPYCAEARRYFHDNEVDYCEYDIERSEEGKKRYAAINGKGIPVLIFGEKYRYDGYSEAVVERALAMLEKDRYKDAQ